jgi:peptidoglycan hydrolase-like protein with peptidoglycan-binding domain
LGSKNAAAPPGDSAAPAPQATQPPAEVVESDHDFLRRQPQAATPAPATEEETAPQPAERPEQPDARQAAPADFARLFRKTPYETAPPVVQQSTVQRAQMRLAREGFYRGMADGQLSDSLGRALVAYQRDADLPPTGRLDMETLSDLNLLPRRGVPIAPPVPYGYGPPVYRGVWVR